ncbi:MAG: polyprenyl synthetase family protein [Candidatus Hodarchaeales archaeon]
MVEQSLNEVFRYMTQLGQSIEPVMLKFLNKEIDPDFKDLVCWQTSTGGKRLRPALTILFAEAFGGSRTDPEVQAAAAGIELIHTYSLILDDIIDRGDLRRGKKTTRAKYGDEFAILSSIIHREAVFEAAKATGKYQNITLAIYSEAIRQLTEGERLDILFEQKEERSHEYFQKHRYTTISLKDYLGMIKGKTAALIAAACKIGAVISDATFEEQVCAEKYGWAAGLAFQLADDYLDMFAVSKEFGKVIYKDIIEQKLGNFAIVQAFKQLPENDSKDLHAYLTDPNLTDEQRVEKCVPLIEKAEVKELIMEEAEKWANKAKMILSTIELQDGKIRTFLEKIADFSVRRAF